MAIFRLLFMCCVVLVLCISTDANAFSLGELQVLSQHNKPFRAVAAIKLGENEKITSVEAGSSADYSLLNLPYTAAVETIVAKVQEKDGKPFVWLQGAKPIQSSNFYVLLRVSSNRHTYFPFFRIRSPAPDTSTKVREPRVPSPEMKNPVAKPVKPLRPVENMHPGAETPVPDTAQNLSKAVAKPLRKVVNKQSVVSKSPPKDTPSVRGKAFSKVTRTKVTGTKKRSKIRGSLYGPVQKRENLTAIARTLKQGTSSTIFQTLVALWKHNPRHFIHNNMNGLKAGALLKLPTQEQIAQIDNKEARALRLEHALQWHEILRGKKGHPRVSTKLVKERKQPVDRYKPVSNDRPATQKPVVQRPVQPRSSGQRPASQRPADEITDRQRSSDYTSAAVKPSGREPSGRETSGREPSGREPSGREPSGREPSVVVISSTAREEGPHTEDVGMLPRQSKERSSSYAQTSQQQREEDGDLKAILVQLQVITRVLENNQGRQEELEKRIAMLEQSKQAVVILQERVNNLELAKDANQYPIPSTPMGEQAAVSPLDEPLFLWGGVAVVGFSLLMGIVMLWLGRRNLRALLSATAQQEPDLMQEVLKETEPAYDKDYVPSVSTQQLDGIPPQAQKHSVSSNSLEVASKLKNMMGHKL